MDADAAPPRRADRRLLALAALSVVCILVAVGYVALAARRTDLRAVAAAPTAAPDVLAAVRAQPHVMFLESQGDAFRRVALAPLDGIDGGRVLTNLQCQRVHFAAGRGLCLGRNQLGGAFVFDERFQPGETLPISGIPSRARVSPDGRYGAMTVFVTGHSYSEGGFSTETTLVDMAGGKLLGDLERFEVLTPDGAKFEAPDFNFWGVTFARDSNRFYATLGTGGRFYLVEGDVAARRLRVVRDGVECPSLSPDGNRIAFKKREAGGGGPIRWRLAVLDLTTMAETPLAETHSVDDQVEWWDNQHLVYFLPDEGPPATIRPDLWVLPADGSGQARRVGTSAFSPAVVVTG